MSGFETVLAFSAGCMCFNTAITHVPVWWQRFYRWVMFRRTMYISKHTNPAGFLQICNVLNEIVKRKISEGKNAADSVETESLIQHAAHYTYQANFGNGQSSNRTISKVFTIHQAGSFIDIKNYDITIEVLGSSNGIDSFAIHEQRQWGLKDKYICIERFLISLGDVVSKDFIMPVIISDVLATYIQTYGLKLGEDHSKKDNPEKVSVKKLDEQEEKKQEEKKQEAKSQNGRPSEEKGQNGRPSEEKDRIADGLEQKIKSSPGPQSAPAMTRSPQPAPVKLKPIAVANAAADEDQGNKTDDDEKPLLEQKN